jgi:hypothetical protein
MADEYELVALPNGRQTLRSKATGQTFHPVVGPEAEARGIHVAGTRLVERANALADGGGEFVIWDVGLGAAANALAAVGALVDGCRAPGGVRLLSFDSTLGGVDFALAHAEELAYPRRFLEALECLRRTGETSIPLPLASSLQWQTCLGDFPTLLASPARFPAPHAIFFDPYSPIANPEMWTLELFAALRARLLPERPCLLTTYTRSTAVRVTMLLAGFYAGIGRATGEKDETTVATNDPASLDRPLDAQWLERKVYASTNAAPLRAAPAAWPGPVTYTRNPIREADFLALGRHPQFDVEKRHAATTSF